VTESSPATDSPAPSTTEDRIWPIAKLLSGNLLGTGAGAVFFLTASWTLSIEEMGHYAVAISTQWIAVGLVGSGLSVAALRLAADRLDAADLAGASGIVSQSAATALAVTLVAVLVGWAIGIAAPETLGSLPPLIAGWAGARSVIDCIRSGLLASQRFGRAALLMAGTAVTGLTALAIAVMSGPLTLEHLLMAHVAGLSAGSLIAIGLSTPLLRDGIHFSRARQWELLRYARWPSLAEGTRLLQIHIGPILLITFSTSHNQPLSVLALDRRETTEHQAARISRLADSTRRGDRRARRSERLRRPTSPRFARQPLRRGGATLRAERIGLRDPVTRTTR